MSTEKCNELYWHLSVLSAIAGPIERIFEDEQGFVWAKEGEGGEYWLRLFKRDDGEYFIHMDDRYADRLKIMAVAGYIQHCNDKLTYNISSWDELIDEAKGVTDLAEGVRH